MAGNESNQDAQSLQAMVDDAVGKKRVRSRKRWKVVFVVALVVFVASLVALGLIAYSYFQGQQKYGSIAEVASIDASDIAEDAQIESIQVDWGALLVANPDTVAWIYMPDTPINYPVVQGQDNEHYLTYDFDGDAGWLANYGAIFLDCRNNSALIDPVNFIYGHHMNDGSMFAIVSQLTDQAAFDEHRIVYLLTPRGNYRLRTFSLVHCSADDPMVETTFAKEKDRRAYLQDKIDRSVVDPGDIPKPADMGQVFALATCDSYSAGRDVLFAYVLDASAVGLEGEVGLDSNKNSTWFVDDLEVKQ